MVKLPKHYRLTSVELLSNDRRAVGFVSCQLSLGRNASIGGGQGVEAVSSNAGGGKLGRGTSWRRIDRRSVGGGSGGDCREIRSFKVETPHLTLSSKFSVGGGRTGSVGGARVCVGGGGGGVATATEAQFIVRRAFLILKFDQILRSGTTLRTMNLPPKTASMNRMNTMKLSPQNSFVLETS